MRCYCKGSVMVLIRKTSSYGDKYEKRDYLRTISPREDMLEAPRTHVGFSFTLRFHRHSGAPAMLRIFKEVMVGEDVRPKNTL